MAVTDDLDDVRVKALELALEFHRLQGSCTSMELVATAKMFAAYLDATEAPSSAPEPKAPEQRS